ncbi:MAG: hypothetical protein ACP5D7_18890 [Limnospira sp.]
MSITSPYPRRHLRCPRLPLAIYREVAAHLRQVKGVQTGLIPVPALRDDSELSPFDYTQSQVAGLWIESSEATDPEIDRQIEEILAYYGDRHGSWEIDN